MAKTKYIVPAVAMLLCAVSLIGAGYAAYTATLSDTENVDVQNNYLKLTLGTNTATAKVALDYGEAITYDAGAFDEVVYTLNPVTNAIMLYIDLDVAEVEQTATYGKTSDGYTLAAPTVTLKNQAGTTVTLTTPATFSVYLTDNGAITGDALDPNDVLEYNSVYAIVMTVASQTFGTYSAPTYATADAAFAAFAAAIPETADISFTATAHVADDA